MEPTRLAIDRILCPVDFSERSGPLFRRILCAADLTRASEHTLDLAFSLAAEDDAQVTLLHVIDTPPGDTWAGLLVAVPEVGPLRHPLVAQARAELRKAAAHGAPNLRKVIERVETGAPWREILRLADEIDADLIVLGAHRRGALGRMLFGSTASHVVRRANCPVLVVPPPPGARNADRPGRLASAASSPGPRLGPRGPIQDSTRPGMAPAIGLGEDRVATTR